MGIFKNVKKKRKKKKKKGLLHNIALFSTWPPQGRQYLGLSSRPGT
jgi:hypothetical protein